MSVVLREGVSPGQAARKIVEEIAKVGDRGGRAIALADSS
jgi:hypothetical protein